MKDNILYWAENRGILESATSLTQLAKLTEELSELVHALAMDDKDEIKDAIGDMTVVLIILANLCELDHDDCLESAYEVISKRSGNMVNGVFVKD
jgi:NTP pyrophosphatase (non-canonical NTP hydrolase)